MDLVVRTKLSDLLDRPSSTELAISSLILTRNEGEAVEALLSHLSEAIGGVRPEVVFVDDSADHVPEAIRSLQDQCLFGDSIMACPPERRGNGLGEAVHEYAGRWHAPVAAGFESRLLGEKKAGDLGPTLALTMAGPLLSILNTKADEVRSPSERRLNVKSCS